MKIAIPSIGKSIESTLDHRCIRGNSYIIYDSKTKKWFHLNVNQESTETHTIVKYIAQILSSLKVKALISGHCWPDVMNTLQAYNIAVYQGADGKIKDVLSEFESDKRKYFKRIR